MARERFAFRATQVRPIQTHPPAEVATGVYRTFVAPNRLPVLIQRTNTALLVETSPRLRGALMHMCWRPRGAQDAHQTHRIIARLGLTHDDAWREYAFCTIRRLFVPANALLESVNVLRPTRDNLETLRTLIEFADLHWIADRPSTRLELLEWLNR